MENRCAADYDLTVGIYLFVWSLGGGIWLLILQRVRRGSSRQSVGRIAGGFLVRGIVGWRWVYLGRVGFKMFE